jgi:hypothetical protein
MHRSCNSVCAGGRETFAHKKFICAAVEREETKHMYRQSTGVLFNWTLFHVLTLDG